MTLYKLFFHKSLKQLTLTLTLSSMVPELAISICDENVQAPGLSLWVLFVQPQPMSQFNLLSQKVGNITN